MDPRNEKETISNLTHQCCSWSRISKEGSLHKNDNAGPKQLGAMKHLEHKTASTWTPRPSMRRTMLIFSTLFQLQQMS
eukprot:1138237-Pelagomonas_calceolata.AAC.7